MNIHSCKKCGTMLDLKILEYNLVYEDYEEEVHSRFDITYKEDKVYWTRHGDCHPLVPCPVCNTEFPLETVKL